VFISSILGVVGAGLFALGWLCETNSFISGYPTNATWLFWLLGSVCWIVGAALPWSVVNKALGGAVQLVGFISLCLLGVTSIIAFAVGNRPVVHFLVGIAIAGITTATGIYAIPRARAFGR
jgi:hypothetical protein